MYTTKVTATTMPRNESSVAVIGGGAAGMMAAITAAEAGASVTVYEPNAVLGKKLRITGKGRCNVTNDCSPEEVMEAVTKNPKFLRGALYRFTPADTMDFFESAGVPLKTERGRRVFPLSDRAADISRAMENKMHALSVTVVKEAVTSLLFEDGALSGVVTASGTYRHRSVIVATGGVSYPGTGCRGDGYRFAKAAGLSVTEVLPSLIPIVTKEDTAPLSGLSLKNVTLTVTEKGKTVFSEMGEMLFTHFGVSGPLVLSASAHMRGKMTDYALSIDLKPALDDATLDARLLSDFGKYAQKDFVNALGDLLPQKLIDPVIALSGIRPRVKTGAITRAERLALLRVLKHFPLTPLRFRPIEEAIVTSGGVDVSGIHTKTMMAKACPGLFFAGEVLDVDAYTGGYNLQIAFSTGVAAGQAAADYAAVTQNNHRKDRTPMKKWKIALDGPSSSGKSTLARSLSRELGLIYVDTGALYRAVGLYMLQRGIDPKDADTVTKALADVQVELCYQDGTQSVLLSGKDVGGEIRTPAVSMAASAVSAIPAVRAFLLEIQTDMVKKGGVVMDGRDIGTVIMPDADVKLFLTASAEARARRRYEEMLEKGVECTYEQILSETIARDKADSSRDIAPLAPAADAILFDNSGMEVDETLAEALRLVREKCGHEE